MVSRSAALLLYTEFAFSWKGGSRRRRRNNATSSRARSFEQKRKKMPRIGPFSRGAMRLKVTSKIAINVKSETLTGKLLIRDALAFVGFEAVQ